MADVHEITPMPHYQYEDGDGVVRVYDKDEEQPSNQFVFYMLLKAAIDLLMDDGGSDR